MNMINTNTIREYITPSDPVWDSNSTSLLVDSIPNWWYSSSTVMEESTVSRKEIKDDQELLDLVRGYLVQCVDKILDEKPEEFVKEILKERDEEIKRLNEEIELLKEEIRELNNRLPSGTIGSSDIPLNPFVVRDDFFYNGSSTMSSTIDDLINTLR